MLQEVGFVAGQHEILSETFSKDVFKVVQEQVKRLKECRRKSMKEAEKLNEDLKKAFKNLEVTRYGVSWLEFLTSLPSLQKSMKCKPVCKSCNFV